MSQPGNHDVVFYTNPMSRGRMVRWMLEETGCPYRAEILDFAALKNADYLAINPMGKVPAISHAGQVVTESTEERRVGKECVRTCRSRWSPANYKKKKSPQQ